MVGYLGRVGGKSWNEVRGTTTMLDETGGLEPASVHWRQGATYRWYFIRQFSVCKIRAIG